MRDSYRRLYDRCGRAVRQVIRVGGQSVCERCYAKARRRGRASFAHADGMQGDGAISLAPGWWRSW